jgi:predicted nucleic acid-binding protein
MSKPLFVDTGYIIALINEKDDYHSQALALSEKYDGHRLVTTDAVLLEVGNALSRIARQEASLIIHHFETAEEVTLVRMNPTLFNNAMQWYDKHQDKTWGLVDCLSFSVMSEMGLSTALAFDKHFTQAGFQLAIYQN